MMNILRIILKEFTLNIRNFKANFMMVLFPIVLIMILGAAFSGTFDNAVKLDDVTVLYTEERNESGPILTEAFKSFREGISEELGIIFVKADDVNSGRTAIKDNKYSAYIYVSDNTREIKMYKNERAEFETSLIESALNSFSNTYGAMSAIAANNPAAMAMPEMAAEGDYVAVKSLNEKREPGSLDYYAVTMMTMILMYASLTGFWSIRSDIEQKTGGRILCAPVRKHEMLIGNVVGSICVTIVQGTAVILFSKFILKAYWGEDLITVAFLLLTYSVMSISLGASLAFLFRNGNAASGALNTIIPIFVFLGGGYVPLDVMGGTVGKLSDISPVKWVNTALFGIIYDGDYSRVMTSVLVNVGTAAAFIAIAALFAKRGNRLYA